jgi:SAM-dependent methyltransferase
MFGASSLGDLDSGCRLLTAGQRVKLKFASADVSTIHGLDPESLMSPKDLLSHPAVYRLWQAPFAAQKLRPVLGSGAIANASRVLDVGCGPGTNARSFADAESYVGVDISERYVAYASKHFAGDFRVADVTAGQRGLGQFDLILMNSLMHHLDDVAARRLLASLPALLTPGGEVQIVDLVLSERGIPRRLAVADRGDFPRTIQGWQELISGALQVKEIRPFHVGLGPLALWELVYVRSFAVEV